MLLFFIFEFIAFFLNIGTYRGILAEAAKQRVKVVIGRFEIIGGGAGIWPAVAQSGPRYKENYLSGSSTKSFTPDTADISRKRSGTPLRVKMSILLWRQDRRS